MATLLPAAGDPRPITPANGSTFTLAELQALVGGYIEGLRTSDGHWVFVNEDGRYLDLPPNRAATLLLYPRYRDVIVGDAVVCSPVEAGDGTDVL